MIQLTQKGKEIYGNYKVEAKYEQHIDRKAKYFQSVFEISDGESHVVIATNPLELKALLDMGLIEIK